MHNNMKQTTIDRADELPVERRVGERRVVKDLSDLEDLSESQKRTLDCMDCWARDAAMPTYSSLYLAAGQYNDMLRKICFQYSAGGYNSEGLIDPVAADRKIRWIIDEASRPAPAVPVAAELPATDVSAHPAWQRPIYYTDTINGQQTCRDDLWAITTTELKDLLRAPALPVEQPNQLNTNELMLKMAQQSMVLAATGGQSIAEPDTATQAPTDNLNNGMHASIFVKVWGDAGGGDAGRIALAQYAFDLGVKSAATQAAKPPTNEEIRTIMHNYSRMHQPGHYSDTEFDCLQDVIGFARAIESHLKGE